MWVPFLKAKYFFKVPFITSSLKNQCSSLWRSIQTIKSKLFNNIVWSIVDRKACIFYDYWAFFCSQSPPKTTRVPRESSDNWPINFAWLWILERGSDYKVFDTASTGAILNTHISRFAQTRGDILVWVLEKSKKFTVRFAYKNLMKHENSTNTSTFKKLWAKKEIQPWIFHFIWRSLNDALMTNDRRARVLSGINGTCPLCNNGVELASYLLLHYPSVKDVWCHGNIDFKIMADCCGTNWGRRKNTNQTHNQRHQNFTWKIQIRKNHGVARKITILLENL